MRLKPEVDKRRVLHLPVVLGRLHPGIVQVLDRDRPRVSRSHHRRDLADRHRLGHLVEHPVLARGGRVLDRQPDARDRVADVDQPAHLPARPVHGQRVPDHRLDHEPVQHRPEHGVVVEPGGETVIQQGLGRRLPVHHALVQVGRPQVPDPAGELDVVRVMHLRQVIERPRPLREQHAIRPPVVLEVEPALLDVDVGRAVGAHRAQLDQVDARVDLRDRVQQRQRAEHVVRLGVERVRPVDHRVRRGPLLGEVHDGVRPERPDHRVGEDRVAQVAHVAPDGGAGQRLPQGDPGAQRLDRHQRLDPELVVVVPASEVVGHRHLMAAGRQVKRRRPAQVAVTAKHQDSHAASSRPAGVGRLGPGRCAPGPIDKVTLRSDRPRVGGSGRRREALQGNVKKVRVTEASSR